MGSAVALLGRTISKIKLFPAAFELVSTVCILTPEERVLVMNQFDPAALAVVVQTDDGIFLEMDEPLQVRLGLELQVVLELELQVGPGLEFVVQTDLGLN